MSRCLHLKLGSAPFLYDWGDTIINQLIVERSAAEGDKATKH